jgi:hypothetical protein
MGRDRTDQTQAHYAATSMMKSYDHLEGLQKIVGGTFRIGSFEKVELVVSIGPRTVYVRAGAKSYSGRVVRPDSDRRAATFKDASLEQVVELIEKEKAQWRIAMS